MKVNDFDTQIQSDEIASIGGRSGQDWVNDVDDRDNDEFVGD